MVHKNTETDEAHVLKLITEPQSRKIMESIQENPKSVIQISKEIGVLQSMIYRRLHKFEKYNTNFLERASRMRALSKV